MVSTVGPRSEATVPAPPRRDSWLDNARFVLIALVVFGHLLERVFAEYPWLHTAYDFIYTFHMPAFAFLSGAVARPQFNAKLGRSVLFRLLWPYLAFEGLYALAALLPLWPDAGPGSVTTPYWLMWYLLSLACWRLLLPLFARLPRRLLIAVAVALAAGWVSDIGYFLSLSRTLVFFPLFLLGWQTTPRWQSVCCKPGMRGVAVLVLAATFAGMAWWQPDARWLYASVGYGTLDTGKAVGTGIRLLLLLTAAACTFSVLALVPRTRTRISAPGARSLGAYVLQGFIIKVAAGIGVFSAITIWPGSLAALVLAAVAAAIAWALASRPAAWLLRPFTSPRWLEHWLWPSRGPSSQQGQ